MCIQSIKSYSMHEFQQKKIYIWLVNLCLKEKHKKGGLNCIENFLKKKNNYHPLTLKYFLLKLLRSFLN